MMEMKSNLSDDAGNEPYSRPQESSRIRNGTRVIHAHFSNLGDIQRRRRVGSNAPIRDGDDDPSSYLNNNIRNNSKYERKENRTRRQRGGRRNTILFFVMFAAVSCIVGFIWMLSVLHSSSPRRLRRDDAPAPANPPNPSAHFSAPTKRTHKGERLEKTESMIANANNEGLNEVTFKIGTNLRKQFTEDDGKMKYYSGKIHSFDPKEGTYKIVYEDGDEEDLTKKEVSKLLENTKKMEGKPETKTSDVETDRGGTSELHVPYQRFDALDKKGKTGITDLMSKIHPKSIQFQGGNNPIIFRTFPSAKNIIGPMKRVDPDYGEIAYESLRNNSKFSRAFPDNDNNIAPGGFDSNSFETITSLKTRNQQSRGHSTSNHPISRTDKFDPKAEGVQPGQLRQFYDDDRVRITYAKGDRDISGDDDDDDESADGETVQTGACRAMEWEYSYYPTCNAFHEIDLARPFDDPLLLDDPRPENSMLKVTYINHGFYRDVFLMEDNPWLWPLEYKDEHIKRPTETYGVLNEDEVAERVAKAYRSAVLKIFSWERPMDDENREMVNIEAVVMERLKKSPRIIDIYGHCGYSISAEVVPIEFEEVVIHEEGYASPEEVEEHHKDGLRPYNNFTTEEKLGFALSMAESIADLHGFSEGIIVHDDIQLCQWLRLPDGTMKLGDFNRASIMEYDVVNEKYCKFNNGYAFGNYRAPEEFAAKDLDEKIDVFSFGNNIYSMLVGLWGFYDIDDDKSTQKALTDGKLPYIDPRWKKRSYVERRLVELMEKCWAYNPDDRIDIFYAVEFLRETFLENNKLNKNNAQY